MAERLRLGVIGLGRAFTLMLPTFASHPRISLVAATDPRGDAVSRFAAEFGATGYETAASLCNDSSVQAVYVASPHQFHLEHVALAAAAGKHVLVEKPMALTLRECERMIEVTTKHGVYLLVGHSHSFDLPYLHARSVIRSGRFGRLRMVNALNFTDFLYRPRRPEELDTKAGGGVVFSQAAHQVDIVRLLATSKAASIRAFVGRWDASRPTEGAYNAQLEFEDGSFASLTYSGYAHFDSDEFMDWWGELGLRKQASSYGRTRRTLMSAKSPAEETELKNKRAYGPSGRDAFKLEGVTAHNHFGLIVASCDGADLRPTPSGVEVYADFERFTEALPAPTVPRAEVVDELCDAVLLGQPPLHSGEWGMATVEACLGILTSAEQGCATALRHQV